MIKDDYAKADIPMLPVVRGVKHTTIQIMLYTVILSAVSIMFGVVSDALLRRWIVSECRAVWLGAYRDSPASAVHQLT